MRSLCENCENVRYICTARSRFLLCQLSATSAAYPKYPLQPVVRCDGYRSRKYADERSVTQMLPLYHDPHFTFRFDDDRIIPRFHLEGVEAGRRVAVYMIDPDSGERLGLLATATVGEGGWVDLPEPITVRAGKAFIAIPEPLGPSTPGHRSVTLPLVGEAGRFAVCKLPPGSAIPAWATAGDVFSVTRTGDELSVVCRQEMVPSGTQAEVGWRCLRVVGAMPFTLVGVLASITVPLAGAGVGVFAVSTFDTDYLFVKDAEILAAVDALRGAGHSVEGVLP